MKLIKFPFKPDELTDEVWSAMMIQYSGGPVGLDTYTEVKRIISENPKYFPWEAAYNKIPESVHKAYKKERDDIQNDRYFNSPDVKEANEKGFYGLIPTINYISTKRQVTYDPSSVNITELFEEVWKSQELEREIIIKREKQNKKLWDKHYKKYKLSYPNER